MIIGIVLALIFLFIRISFRARARGNETNRVKRRPMVMTPDISETWVRALKAGQYDLGFDPGFVFFYNAPNHQNDWKPKGRHVKELMSGYEDYRAQLRLWSFLIDSQFQENVLGQIDNSFMILNQPGRILFAPGDRKGLFQQMSTISSNINFYFGRIMSRRSLSGPFYLTPEFSQRPLLAWIRYGEKTIIDDIPQEIQDQWKKTLAPGDYLELATVLPGLMETPALLARIYEDPEVILPACLEALFSDQSTLEEFLQRPHQDFLFFLETQTQEDWANRLLNRLGGKKGASRGALAMVGEERSGHLTMEQ